MGTQAAAQVSQSTSAGMSSGGGMGAVASGASSSNSMLTTLLIIVAIIAAFIIIENVVQFFLARKGKFYWGLILPAAHLIYGVVRGIMIVIGNKSVTGLTLTTVLSSTLGTTIIRVALISLLFLELLTEYFLVRKYEKPGKKLKAAAAEAEDEEVVGI